MTQREVQDMIYCDYEFYTNEYLLGREATITEEQFQYYGTMASAEVRNVISLEALDGEPTEEIKMATCEVAEMLCRMDGNSSSDSTVSIPYGVSSETVGEYSISYAGNTDTEKVKAKSESVKAITKKWLGPSGLLFRGVI